MSKAARQRKRMEITRELKASAYYLERSGDEPEGTDRFLFREHLQKANTLLAELNAMEEKE